MDWTQLILNKSTGWWKSTEPGTSCSIGINGTTQGGAVAACYLTDLLVTSSTIRPVHLYCIDGTTGGTNYLLRLEFAGTRLSFNPQFHVFPHTSIGTGLYLHAEAVSNGTVCMSAGGFNV